jgi:hypothetical protein
MCHILHTLKAVILISLIRTPSNLKNKTFARNANVIDSTRDPIYH